MSYIEFIRKTPHSHSFTTSLQTPLEPDPFELLKCYRTTLEGLNVASYNSLERDFVYPYFPLIFPKNCILSRESFVEFN